MATAPSGLLKEYITKIRGSEKCLSIIMHRERDQLSFTDEQWEYIKQRVFFIAFFSEQLTLTSQSMKIGKNTLTVPSQYSPFIIDLCRMVKSNNWKISAKIYKPGSPIVSRIRRASLLGRPEESSEAMFNLRTRLLKQKK